MAALKAAFGDGLEQVRNGQVQVFEGRHSCCPPWLKSWMSAAFGEPAHRITLLHAWCTQDQQALLHSQIAGALVQAEFFNGQVLMDLSS